VVDKRQTSGEAKISLADLLEAEVEKGRDADELLEREDRKFYSG
jgi:hypothetical protein